MAVIKVRDPSSGQIKKFNIKGDTPTDTEKQRILNVLQQTPRLGQLKGLEQAGDTISNKDRENFELIKSSRDVLTSEKLPLLRG